MSTEGAIERDCAEHGPGKNLEALSHKRRRLGMNGFLGFLQLWTRAERDFSNWNQ